MSDEKPDFNFFGHFLDSNMNTIFTIGMIVASLYQFLKLLDKKPKIAFRVLSLSLFVTLIITVGFGSTNVFTEYVRQPYNIILFTAMILTILVMPITLYYDFKSDDELVKNVDESEKNEDEVSSHSSKVAIIMHDNQELIDSKKRKILIEIDNLKLRLSEHEEKKDVLESDLWLDYFKTKTGFLAITENEYGRNKVRQTAIDNEETEIRSLRARINGLKENADKLSTSVVC